MKYQLETARERVEEEIVAQDFIRGAWRELRKRRGHGLKKQLRPVRAMLHCYFCGGRVVSTKLLTYRCEAEGVSWDMAENLVIYERFKGAFPNRDAQTGKYLPGPATVEA